MKIILFQPQIPQNAGNIVRTCAVTGADLVMVEPLGFGTSDKMLRRAGLDYWEGVDVEIVSDLETYLESTEAPFFFFSSHAKKNYSDCDFPKESILIFGSETSGLPEKFRERWPERFATIPMLPEARCLNLASSAAIVVYEAWRQNKFES